MDMSDSPKSTPEIAAEIPVFSRLGTLVRSLHDALREIGAEKVLTEAASEFPSARERLQHIGRLTEKAANTVLSKVEETIPIQDQLAESAKELIAKCNDVSIASQVPDALKPLIGQMTQLITSAHDGSNITRAALSDMMMAQDFQDLTGQLIKKVVALLEHTEKDLLKLLIDAAPPGAISEVKKEEVMAGPGAPGGIALEQQRWTICWQTWDSDAWFSHPHIHEIKHYPQTYRNIIEFMPFQVGLQCYLMLRGHRPRSQIAQKNALTGVRHVFKLWGLELKFWSCWSLHRHWLLCWRDVCMSRIA